MSSDYAKSLEIDVLNRYADKISAINKIDPYTVPNETFAQEVNPLPEITVVDLMNYFVLTYSAYSGQQMKNYKALQAYKYVESGFVENVKHAKLSENFVVIGLVRHGQRMNDKFLKSWLIIQPNGSILSGHCTCMAGLGETCTHTAALAFYLLSNTQDELSCTDQLAKWPVPKLKKKLEFKQIKDIYFGKCVSSFEDVETKYIPPIEGSALHSFLEKIKVHTPNAAILKVTPPFASEHVPKKVQGLPKPLNTIYNEVYREKSLEELQKINLKIVITKENQMAVYDTTEKQSRCRVWFEQRSGRITASQFKAACSGSIKSKSLIKGICYPKQAEIKVPSLQYGVKHESQALDDYELEAREEHTNLSVYASGFVIKLNNPIFGALPDGSVKCDCCGVGIIEVKCPYKMHELDIGIDEFSRLKDTCLLQTEDGIKLNKTHSYYFQVQLQLYCTEVNYCDFIVWSKKRPMHIERVRINEEFLEQNIKKAEKFHSLVIVPELLSRILTQPVIEPLLTFDFRNEKKDKTKDAFQNDAEIVLT